LGEHPAILQHPQPEFTYFTGEQEFALGYRRALGHYYKNEKNREGRKLLAKSALLYISETGIRRLYEHNPAAKLVLTLRNPVDKAYSAYLMYYNRGDVNFPFREIIDIAGKKDHSYWPFTYFLYAGLYATHLETIYKYFPKEQVTIIFDADYVQNTAQICKNIFDWLRVDSTFTPTLKVYNQAFVSRSRRISKLTLKLLKPDSIIRSTFNSVVPEYYNYNIRKLIGNMNKTQGKYEPMDAEIRKFLVDYFLESNKALEELTGRNISAIWNK
jgi:hypothetical protein